MFATERIRVGMVALTVLPIFWPGGRLRTTEGTIVYHD